MKSALIVLFLALCAFSAPKATAACHFSSYLPIVCYQALPAAIAFNKLGNDYVRIAQSYNQKILNDAGCGTPFSKSQLKAAVIQIRNHGRVATGTGWVPVSMIEVDRRVDEIYYVADGYLSGVCAKYQPGTDVD